MSSLAVQRGTPANFRPAIEPHHFVLNGKKSGGLAGLNPPDFLLKKMHGANKSAARFHDAVK